MTVDVMEKEQLQQLIAKLHDELKSADSVDQGSRQLLGKLTRDIENLPAGESAPTGATGQLEEAALKFESEHPKLSLALGELVDALGKLGI